MKPILTVGSPGIEPCLRNVNAKQSVAWCCVPSPLFISKYLMCKSVCLHVCMCTVFVPGAQGGQKKALDLLELELQTVVFCRIGARN